jgi:DNA-binding MarR family transcriptional regulator
MRLFLLGRKLMDLAEGSLPKGKLATSVRLVLIDVAHHPGSSITQITERTTFPQSLVSVCVARLRELGFVEASPDPSDRRRTLVNAIPAALQAKMQAGATPVEELLARELPPERRGEVGEAAAALELLARLLIEDTAHGSAQSGEQDPV